MYVCMYDRNNELELICIHQIAQKLFINANIRQKKWEKWVEELRWLFISVQSFGRMEKESLLAELAIDEFTIADGVLDAVSLYVTSTRFSEWSILLLRTKSYVLFTWQNEYTYIDVHRVNEESFGYETRTDVIITRAFRSY